MPRRRFRKRDEDGSILKVNAPEESGALRPVSKAERLMQIQRTLGNRWVQNILDDQGAKPQRKTFRADDSAALKPAYIENPNARDDTEKDCREVMPTGLKELLRHKSNTEQGKEPPDDISLKATIDKYMHYRLVNYPYPFEFTDERNKLTRGENEPQSLSDKVEDKIIKMVKDHKGWHLLGLSIMDAARKVLIAVDNRNPSAQRIYWIDREEGGYKDVTNRLDDRITQITRQLWHAQPSDQRRRTRVTFWTFAPP